MKPRLRFSIIVILTLVFGVFGCAAPLSQPTPTQPPATQVSSSDNPRSAIVQDMIRRLNAGDSEGSLAYFSDNARIYFIGMPPAGMEIYQGVEQLRPVWEDCVSGHFKWEADITTVDGDVVTARTKTWHDFTRQLEVAPNEFTDVYVVEDGKITAYASTITEDALAKFRPALAKVMPPVETPPLSAESPASKMTVTLMDGTCTYTGSTTLQAGEIEVIWDIKDQDKEMYGLTLFTLDADKDIVDLMAATSRPAPPSWAKMILYQERSPGASQTYSLKVEKGPIYGVCWSKPPDLPIGVVGPFVVNP